MFLINQHSSDVAERSVRFIQNDQHRTILAGWWLSHPSEKYESQWEGLSHILWKIIQMFETTNHFEVLPVMNCNHASPNIHAAPEMGLLSSEEVATWRRCLWWGLIRSQNHHPGVLPNHNRWLKMENMGSTK